MTPASIYGLLLLLAALRLLHDHLVRGRGLGESAYRQPLLVRVWLASPRHALIAAALAVPALFRFHDTSWQAMGGFEPFRWAAAAMALSLAWAAGTSARNLFLGRTYGADRLLLLALAALVAVHPAAAPVFLVHLTVFVRQYEHPACMLYSFTEMRLPLDLLMLVSAWPLVSMLAGPPPETLLVAVLSITAAAYVIPGIAKVQMGGGVNPWRWLRHNQVHRLVVSAYQQGWLGSLPCARMLALARVLKRFNFPIAVITLAIELAGVALLAGPDLALWLLAAWVGLHAVILLTSGINFWKWVLTDLALAWMVASLGPEAAAALFRPEHLAASIAIIATQSLHARCMRLGWLDGRLNNFFRIEAVGASGRARPLPRGFFAPYDVVFAQCRHFFLCPWQVLVNAYGVIDRRGLDGWRLFTALEATNGRPDALEQVRARFGVNHRNDRLAAEFERFIIESLTLINAGPTRCWWSAFAAPRHIYCGNDRPDSAAFMREPIVAVRIYAVETWYDDREIRTLHDRLVREFAVPQVTPATPAATAPAPVPVAA